MRYLLAAVLLLAAPAAAQLPTTTLDAVAAGLNIANWDDCKANDVLVFEEDGKLWCRQPIDFAAVDITAASTADVWECREPDCFISEANLTVDWPEIEFTTRAAPVTWTGEVSAPAFSEIIGPDTGFLLRLDGTWQLIVNNAPYTCTPEEDRK